MTTLTSQLDPRRVLSHPLLYESFQRIVGKTKLRRRFVADYIQPTAGMRILDIGCGPGDLVPHLPDNIDYTGCDVSAPYVEAAQERVGNRARFYLGGVEELPSEVGTFDRIVTVGVLHHVPDNTAKNLVRTARDLLRPGGRFIALEPHFHDGMHPISRALISRDRGQFVRTEPEYVMLCEQGLKVTTHREENYLRVPYSLTILNCSVD